MKFHVFRALHFLHAQTLSGISGYTLTSFWLASQTVTDLCLHRMLLLRNCHYLRKA